MEIRLLYILNAQKKKVEGERPKGRRQCLSPFWGRISIPSPLSLQCVEHSPSVRVRQ